MKKYIIILFLILMSHVGFSLCSGTPYCVNNTPYALYSYNISGLGTDIWNGLNCEINITDSSGSTLVYREPMTSIRGRHTWTVNDSLPVSDLAYTTFVNCSGNGTAYMYEDFYKVENNIFSYLTDINDTTKSTQNAVNNVLGNITEIKTNLTNIYTLMLSMSSDIDDIIIDLDSVALNVSNLVSFSVSINDTSAENNQILYEILSALDGNFTIVIDNLSTLNLTVDGDYIANLTRDRILLADIIEFSLSDSGTTYGTGLGKSESSTLTANAVLGGVAYASPSDVLAVCLDNSTLQLSLDSTRCIDGNCINLERNSTVTCQFGCNSETYPNECNPSPFQTNLLIVIVLFVLVAIVAVSVYKLK